MKKLLISLLLLLSVFTVSSAKNDKKDKDKGKEKQEQTDSEKSPKKDSKKEDNSDKEGKNMCPVQIFMREPDPEFLDKKGRFVLGKSKFTTGWRYAGTEYFLVASGGKVSKETGWVEGAKWGIVDRNGKEKLPVDYDGISEPIHDMFYYCEKDLIGICNIDIRQVTEPIYSSVGAFDDRGFTWVADKKGRLGLISETGSEILPCEVEAFHLFSTSFDEAFSSAPTPQGIALEFSLYQAFPDSSYVWFTTESTSQPGLVNPDGKVVVQEGKYDKIYLPTDGMMRFSVTSGKGKKSQQYMGFYDTESGREYETRASHTYYPFKSGVSLVTDGSEYWFADKRLKDISGHYTEAYNFNGEYAIVGRNGMFGVVNRGGQEVVPLIYDAMEKNVTDGSVAARQGGLWGAVSVTGEEIIPFEYSRIASRGNGCFSAQSNGTWGLIGTGGKIYLQPGLWQDFKLPENYPPTDYYWVQENDNLWYYYDITSESVAFPSEGEGFDDVWLFGDADFAPVFRMGDEVKWYGAVRKDGSFAVAPDGSFTSEAALAKALAFLQQNGYSVLSGAALVRYRIQEDDTRNTHYLAEVIPDGEWDF